MVVNDELQMTWKELAVQVTFYDLSIGTGKSL
jgi:hypothetical protein